jgi:hypothetical protein
MKSVMSFTFIVILCLPTYAALANSYMGEYFDINASSTTLTRNVIFSTNFDGSYPAYIPSGKFLAGVLSSATCSDANTLSTNVFQTGFSMFSSGNVKWEPQIWGVSGILYPPQDVSVGDYNYKQYYSKMTIHVVSNVYHCDFASYAYET